MDGRWWLKELAILVMVCEIRLAEADLLESFRVKANDPPEVGEFLNNVLEHRSDFDYVREVARKYQNMASTPYLDSGLSSLSGGQDLYRNNEYNDLYKINHKRHAPAVRRVHKRLKKHKKKPQRSRRHLPVAIFSSMEDEDEDEVKEPRRLLKKSRREGIEDAFADSLPAEIYAKPYSEVSRFKRNMRDEVVIEPEGDKGKIHVVGEKHPKIKKQITNVGYPGVHRTYKAKKMKMSRENDQNKHIEYIQLGNREDNNQENTNDMRLSRWYLHKPNHHRETDIVVKQQPEGENVPHQAEPLHHNPDDEVAFEKAVSYEIEPGHEEVSDENNPQGNNLYSVDEGRPDRIELLYPEKVKVEDEGKDMTNERFFMDVNNNLRKSESAMHVTGSSVAVPTTTTATRIDTAIMKISKTTEGNEIKIVKQVGEGFIEISRAQKEGTQENHEHGEGEPAVEIINKPVERFAKEDRYEKRNKVRETNPVFERKLAGNTGGREKLESHNEGADISNDPVFEKKFIAKNEEQAQSDENVIEEPLQSFVKDDTYENHNIPRDVEDKSAFEQKLMSESKDQQSLLSDNVEKKDVDDVENEKAIERRNDQSSIISNKFFDLDQNDNIKAEDEIHNNNNNNEESSILFKNSLHPLRLREAFDDQNEENFQSRKLQSFNERVFNSENQDDDYDIVPKRARRDFLDALGMKNEEDYSEDNPYKNILNDNNTDCHNDTHHRNITEKPHRCSPSTSSTTTTPAPTDKCVQKEDISTIKQILEEPKEELEQSTIVNFKKHEEQKRLKKSSSDLDIYKETMSSRKERTIRDIPEDVKTKILENKEKIYNYREDNRNHYSNSNYYRPIKRGLRQHHWTNYRQGTKYDRDIKDSMDVANIMDKKENDESTKALCSTPIPFVNYTESNEANISSSYEKIACQMDVENEKLTQVVSGHLASKIVCSVYEGVKEKPALKSKLYPGLSRKHADYSGTMDVDIFKTNDSEDVNEARSLVDQITKVLNKIVMTQVRRKLCQRLSDELQEYLKQMVNIKSCLPENNFEPNTNQGDFLFNYQEKQENPSFDMSKMQEVLSELEGLLSNYRNLNAECKNRVEPVKEYIEKHINVLKQVAACPSHTCGQRKRYSNNNNNLMYPRLDRKRKFLPDSEIGELLANKNKNYKWKYDNKREVHRKSQQASEKYKKLQMAAAKVREKREYERKISDMFGAKQKRSSKRLNFDYEEPVIYRF